MSSDDESIRKAIETCDNLQMMIDISAKTLQGLRASLQSNPSSQASQALREAEVMISVLVPSSFYKIYCGGWELTLTSTK